jgi:hypothetical protein
MTTEQQDPIQASIKEATKLLNETKLRFLIVIECDDDTNAEVISNIQDHDRYLRYLLAATNIGDEQFNIQD